MAEIKKYSTMGDELMVYGGNSSQTATTMQQMMSFMKQEADTVGNIVDGFLWQPNTQYEKGAIVHSANIPAGYLAQCTSEGQSGNNEPLWNEQDKTYSDGTLHWILKEVVGDTEELANRIDALEDNTDGITDYIVDSGRSSDGTIWYRKWKSGWLEQGGIIRNYSFQTVNLLKHYIDSDYVLVLSAGNKYPNNADITPTYIEKTNSHFKCWFDNSTNNSWYACGQGGND